MKNWTIKKRLALGFGIVIALLLVVAGVSVYVTAKSRSTSEGIAFNDVPGLVFGGRVQALQQEQSSLLFHHIASDDAATLSAIEGRMKEIASTVDDGIAAYEKTDLDPTDKELLAAFKDARAAFVRQREAVLELSRQHKDAEALALFEKSGAPLLAAVLKAAEAINERNAASAIDSSTQGVELARVALYAVIGLSTVASVLGIFLAASISTALNRALGRISATLAAGADEIASAAGLVSSSSQTLAQGASEQAASLEETSASMEEIGSMARRNTEGADSARDLSGQARTAAERGAEQTAEMDVSMRAITEASAEMAETILEIKASSDDVAKIVKTIDGIAFQTNILALNAAVEAARAGESGAGFAVVADEVRSLAQRSSEAAKEIARMIDVSVSRSARGVEVNGKVSARLGEIAEKSQAVRESLDRIMGKVREVDTVVTAISTASQEQNTGLSQITTAMSQMDQVTQANAAAAEETASAAEELNSQSVELRNAVGDLVLLVQGPGEASERRAPVPVAAAPLPVSRIPFPSEPSHRTASAGRKPAFR